VGTWIEGNKGSIRNQNYGGRCGRQRRNRGEIREKNGAVRLENKSLKRRISLSNLKIIQHLLVIFTFI